MSRKYRLPGLAILCLLLAACSPGPQGQGSGSATNSGVSGDVVAGREKSATCVACHGALGASDNERWPDLAGQSAAYLAKQLRDFRAGRRHDPWMSPMAKPLSDQDIDNLAAWFGSIEGVTGGPEKLAPQAMACVACHSAQAVATNPEWPRLAGQNSHYLAKQLRDFRDGVRVDPVMAPLARPLSDRDLEDLAQIFASL